MQVSTDNTKRRRTSSSPNDDSILSLSTLPCDHLTNVSSYLAPTSKILLACALSAPSTSFGTVNWKGDESLTNESKAILTSMGSTIEVLDFGDIGDLAGKLTDDDIAAVLVCIDAKMKLKKLLLTGCNGFIGHGLECLRESTVLEQMSLHLPMETLSTSVITPILDSIVDSDGNSLREIKVTNTKHAKNDLAEKQFLKKFNKLRINEDKCEACVHHSEGEDHEVNTASLTCFECFFCTCEECNDYQLSNFGGMRCCAHCGLSFCKDHGFREECYACGKFHCSTCAKITTLGATQRCEDHHCHYQYCLDCIGDGGCESCLGKHFPALYARKSEQEEELNGEITQLRSDKSDLAEENEELRREIEELRKNMSSGLGILS